MAGPTWLSRTLGILFVGSISSIAAGEGHTCAITDAGAVKCWGWNWGGQLGNGEAGGDSMSPVPVDVVGLGSDAVAVAAGGDYTCVLTSQGGVECWGGNYYGQLGRGARQPPTPTIPQGVVGLESGVASLSAGTFHACVLTSQGTAKCWGDDKAGQVGDGSASGKGLPMDVHFDADLDGCIDARELGPDARLGGRRDPKSFWDFFDTPPRDGTVTVGDILGLVKRFGTSGDPAIDPLSTPPPSGYHPAFDRSAPAPSGDPWDLGAADGSIVTSDLLFALNQFGHTCA